MDSIGRRNTVYLNSSQRLFERLRRCLPAEGLSTPGVERVSDGRQVAGAVSAQVCALGKVLPKQAIRILVCASLPGAVTTLNTRLEQLSDKFVGQWLRYTPAELYKVDEVDRRDVETQSRMAG